MTIREFILLQSTLPTGSTIREHLLHPSSGGVGQVIGNLLGTVISRYEVSGTVVLEDSVAALVTEDTSLNASTSNANIEAVLIKESLLEGIVNE